MGSVKKICGIVLILISLGTCIFLCTSFKTEIKEVNKNKESLNTINDRDREDKDSNNESDKQEDNNIPIKQEINSSSDDSLYNNNDVISSSTKLEFNNKNNYQGNKPYIEESTQIVNPDTEESKEPDIKPSEESNIEKPQIVEGNYKKVENVNLDGKQRIVARISSEKQLKTNNIEVFLDNINNDALGSMSVNISEDEDPIYKLVSLEVSKPMEGTHNIYLKFNDDINIEWVKFTNVVNFDERYGKYIDSIPFGEVVTRALEELNPYDSLIFNKSKYNVNRGTIIVSKPVEIRGADPIEFDPSKQGASGVITEFNELGEMQVFTDDFILKNIRAYRSDNKGVLITPRVINFQSTTSERIFKGIQFENVSMYGAMYNMHCGSGLGGSFKNVSFENYKECGFIVDRRKKFDSNPQLTFDKCYFRPTSFSIEEDTNQVRRKLRTDRWIYFNSRAISFDAGNDEYGVTWNMNKSIIQNCLFEDGSIAFSKINNVIIRNNTMTQIYGGANMIHIEEFSNNFKIYNNVLDSTLAKPDNIFVGEAIICDRENQFTSNIRFSDNIIKGPYRYFISGYSPQGFIIENNDFTEAYERLANSFFFDFEWAVDLDKLEKNQHVGATNIIFKGNSFSPENLAKNNLRIAEFKGDTSNNIQSDIVIQRDEVAQIPSSIVDTSKSYRIRNKGTGEYLFTDKFSGQIYFSILPRLDKSDIWEFGFDRHIYNSIKSKFNGNYMETRFPFNAGHIKNGTEPPEIDVKAVSNYSGKSGFPLWTLLRKNIEGKDYFLLHPGYSEFRSRLTRSTKCNWLITEVAMLNKPRPNYKEFEDEDLWELIPVD